MLKKSDGSHHSLLAYHLTSNFSYFRPEDPENIIEILSKKRELGTTETEFLGNPGGSYGKKKEDWADYPKERDALLTAARKCKIAKDSAEMVANEISTARFFLDRNQVMEAKAAKEHERDDILSPERLFAA